MSQLTKVPSMLSTVAGTKAGNQGESPSMSRRGGSITIAIEGEGGLAFVQKMMAQGGPAGTGETLTHVTTNYPHLTLPMPVNLFPIHPSPASEIQEHPPFLFASRLVEHYSGTQGPIPATKAPATEAVVPQEKAQST